MCLNRNDFIWKQDVQGDGACSKGSTGKHLQISLDMGANEEILNHFGLNAAPLNSSSILQSTDVFTTTSFIIEN